MKINNLYVIKCYGIILPFGSGLQKYDNQTVLYNSKTRLVGYQMLNVIYKLRTHFIKAW
jgi:hypothetical protein